MATPRRPLGEINSNIIPHKDLSPYVRGKIARKAKEGKKIARIVADLDVPDYTVCDTLKLDPLRNKGISRPRPSRPDKYSNRFKLNLISFVQKKPKSSMAKIQKHM
jgi:hypothetical protein